MTTDTSLYDATAALLDAELPDRRFRDGSYLHWLYDENPLGAGIHESVDEDGRRIAHYGLIPQEYRDAQGSAPFVFSLNAVTGSGVQRRGYFSEIGGRIWAEASRRGALAVVGVTNDKSLKPVVRLGWRMIGRLPVLASPVQPVRPGRYASFAAEPAWLDSSAAEEVLEGLDEAPATAWTNRWTTDTLRWRLRAPNCGPYVVHGGDEVVAVSTLARVRGLRVAVVLKLLRRGSGARPVSGRGALAAAAAYHRAPLVVYCGFNRYVRVRGFAVPDRFKPAPLNLMVYALSPRIDQATFAFDTFELLDMDAF